MPNMIMSTMNFSFAQPGWHKTSATSVGYLSQQQENTNQFTKWLT